MQRLIFVYFLPSKTLKFLKQGSAIYGCLFCKSKKFPFTNNFRQYFPSFYSSLYSNFNILQFALKLHDIPSHKLFLITKILAKIKDEFQLRSLYLLKILEIFQSNFPLPQTRDLHLQRSFKIFILY